MNQKMYEYPSKESAYILEYSCNGVKAEVNDLQRLMKIEIVLSNV
jgi:hypothetical protein